ncbi:30S ribosomal protein S7 [Nanoarchaeota archaeon NZ13-N]|uniref:30S ribosomal protein S7 n=1 Tax=Candidatus Nanoclepta minutus TaxID=1940235 RepID=A0A397WPY0_9ARCH|nr:MAG: 30S ribosomal protein S7 [Nanoarchaeota archaeon NZ13-N]RIB35607.1 MAG: 30S ribosomal protein S7 [Candidatus Nanoclepta minutus]
MRDLKDLKFFGRWRYEIELEDESLMKAMNTKPYIIPKAAGRYQKKRFGSFNIPIIDRLIGRLMTPGHFGRKHKFTSYRASGKYYKCLNIVIKAFEIIEKETGENPIKVFSKAIENAAPREEITTIEMGGARYPKAVDISPKRRVDIAIRHIVWGAYHKSRNKGKMYEALAKEIIAAYKNSIDSYAISKKLELERLASSSR